MRNSATSDLAELEPRVDVTGVPPSQGARRPRSRMLFGFRNGSRSQDSRAWVKALRPHAHEFAAALRTVPTRLG